MRGGRSISSRRTTTSGEERLPRSWVWPHWTGGDLEAAHRRYAEAMASLEKAGYMSDVIGCAVVLADIRIAQGRLRDAISTYERGLQVATEQAGPVLRGAADMHVGMSELLRERNDLDAASAAPADERGAGRAHWSAAEPRTAGGSRWLRIREAEGDLERRPRPARRGGAPVRRATSTPMCGRSQR